jgi:hypothetical protein
VVSNTEVSGSVTSGHFCGAGLTYTLYFDVPFDQPFTTNGTAVATGQPNRAANPDKPHGVLPPRPTVKPGFAHVMVNIVRARTVDRFGS